MSFDTTQFEAVKPIADAVLYEGYILYPYRASAVKNRQRFNFGTLYPAASAAAGPSSMQTECLVTGDRPSVSVCVRFLQLRSREVGRLANPIGDTWPPAVDPRYELVESLDVDGQTFATWQEAVEREVSVEPLHLTDIAREPQCHAFAFPAAGEIGPLRDAQGQIVGVLVFQQRAIAGTIQFAAQALSSQVYKLSIAVTNDTPLTDTIGSDAGERQRSDALLESLASTHTVLGVADGQFVSLFDPPEEFRAAVAECRNVGTWPVLVGVEGRRDMLLSSPIILYDYPQVAPESVGDFCDGTEIDEMLALRVMTLTDDEKQQMRRVDARARQILERTESLSQEHLMKLHGAVRGMRPARVQP